MSDQFFISRRTLLSAAGVGAAVLTVDGCKKAASSATTTTATGSAAAAGAPTGGTLKIAQSADIALPPIGQNNPNFSIARTVWNTLTEYDHKTLEPKPSLAKSYTLDPAGTTLVFTLRDDVTYHDGRKFTSDDVVKNIEYIQGPKGSGQTQHIAKAFTAVTADSPTQVTIKLATPITNLFDFFEMTLMLDPSTIDTLGKGGTLNGTGPFKVDSYTPGTGFKLSKYAGYWKKDAPALDAVEMTVIKDSQSAISSLKSGQTHLILDLPPIDAAAVKGNADFPVVQSDANDSAYYVGTDVTTPGLTDKRVRQAISYAIDRDRILSQVLGGIGTSGCLPWSATSPAYDAAKNKTYTRDLDKAKGLLAQVPGAAGATIAVSYNAALAANAKIADIVVFNLNELGLKGVSTPLQGPDFQAKLTAGKLGGLFVNNHGFGHLHPATLVNGAFPYKATKNAANFDSDDYRAAATKMWTAGDPASIKAAYDAVNDLLLDQQFMIDLVASTHTFTITGKLTGLNYTMYDYIDLDAARLAK